MSRFNKQSTGTKTINRAGGEAFEQSPKLKIVSLLLTSFVKNQFYRSKDQTINEIETLVEKEPLFSAKAAIFARNKYGMRSITHIVAAKIANTVKGAQWTKKFFSNVIRRVDDITEIFALYMEKYGKPLPNSLKKGLAKAFEKFDAYQLAKYRAASKKYSLVDVVNMVHPKPVGKNAEALKLLVKDKLKSADTWESKLTQAGQIAENEEDKTVKKSEAWAELLQKRKIGYFALLRNLRNILEQAPQMEDRAIELLTDKKLIKKSLVLPFRYVSAFNEIQKISGSQRILMALSKALDISCDNVPKFDGKTCVVLDVSGSMQGQPLEIGSLFAAILIKSNMADLIIFSDYAQYKNVNPADSVLSIQKIITRDLVMAGTDFTIPFRIMNKPYDRIIILSDMQGWIRPYYGSGTLPSPYFNAYKKKYGCDPYVYSWDLQGYGDMQFPERNVFAIAGWSEKVFDIMALLETDKNALISEIESIEL